MTGIGHDEGAEGGGGYIINVSVSTGTSMPRLGSLMSELDKKLM